MRNPLGLAVILGLAAGCTALFRPAVARAEGAPAPGAAPGRDWGFVQAGLGLVEVGHVEAGWFVHPRLNVEAWLAWAAVFGSRAGLGATYAFGTREGGRVPRRGFTVGARLMLDRGLTFDNHGDDLSSYVAVPLGYAMRFDGGLYLRFAVVPIVVRTREESSHEPPPPGMVNPWRHVWRPGGPFITAAIGFVF